MFVDFKKRGRDRKRDKLRCLSYLPPPGMELGMCPDWESNQQSFGSENNAPNKWAIHPGLS